MSNPNWFSWFAFPFFAPLSGAVTQDIETHFRSEDKEMIKEVGLVEQFDTLSRAIMELKKAPLTKGVKGDGNAIAELEKMVGKVNKIKERYSAAAGLEAERALNRLKAVNPARYNTFIREHETRESSGSNADQATAGSAQQSEGKL
ncbi:hypothetical protein [Bradyrhizobium sp. USDA 10063]